MSKIGKQPIAIAEGVEIKISGQDITVKGKLGELNYKAPQDISIKQEEGNIVCTPLNATNKTKALWGTTRSNISNMVTGVSEGYKINLEVNGVGYRAQVQGKLLNLYLGFSHEIKYAISDEVKITCAKPTEIEIVGYDKQLVGQIASDLRRLRPPEPYKGKGIKKAGEYVRRKEGKKK